jgi:hypothetical protein
MDNVGANLFKVESIQEYAHHSELPPFFPSIPLPPVLSTAFPLPPTRSPPRSFALPILCDPSNYISLHQPHAPMDHFLTLDQFDLCADLASEARSFSPTVHHGDTSPIRARPDEAFIPLVNEDHSDGRYDRSAVVGCIIA